MTLDLSTPRSDLDNLGGDRRGWRAAARERRRLARQDRLSAQLVELHHVQALVAGASAVVCSGWVRNGWFLYRDEHDQQRTATTEDLPFMAGRPITGGCLVGAIVTAGGGPEMARTPTVQRALDLTWHTLYGSCQTIRWNPPLSVRSAHMCDLTRWNDQPHRTPEDVTALLHLVERAAGVEIERVRAECRPAVSVR